MWGGEGTGGSISGGGTPAVTGKEEKEERGAKIYRVEGGLEVSETPPYSSVEICGGREKERTGGKASPGIGWGMCFDADF